MPGLIEKPIDPPEYILGANSPIVKGKINESANWESYLPSTEKQRFVSPDSRKYVETMGCVSFSYNNAIEILLKFTLGKEYSYSNRFLTKESGTTRRGNWLQKVCETAREKGVCHEEVWPYPYEGCEYTWEDYYADVSNEALYEAWRIHGKIEHEWVERKDWKDALKYSPLQVTVWAWELGDDGLYRNSLSMQNHAVVLIGYDGEKPIIFDTYDPFIKKLSPDHKMGIYAKSFNIKKPVTMEFKEKVIYKAAVNGAMRVGFVLNGRMVSNVDEQDKFNVIMEAVSRGCEFSSNGIKTISQENWDSISRINLKGDII